MREDEPSEPSGDEVDIVIAIAAHCGSVKATVKVIFKCRARVFSLIRRSVLVLASVILACLAAPAATMPETGSSNEQTLFSTADSLFQEISHLTGLAIKAPLKKRVMNREQMRKFVEENLRTEYTPAYIHEQETVLKAFGLVSPEFDLVKFFVSFYSEQAAGIYDQRSKTMILADWVEPELQNMVLAHELTHALQDQNFDLEKFLLAERSNDDATSARQAITEGYATAAMFQHLLPPAALDSLSSLGSLAELGNMPSFASLLDAAVQQQFTQFPAFTGAPFSLRFQALFPYSQGMAFMQQGLAHGGWARLNQLFVSPPETTRDIFSPQLYFSGDDAAHAAIQENSKLSLPRPKPLAGVAGLKFVVENTMGELGYYSLLGQFISEDAAKSTSAALIEDRYLAYEVPDKHRYALVARTRWTSPEGALSFFRNYHTILAKKFLEMTPDSRSTPDLFIGSTASGTALLLRNGDQCVWAEGVPAAQTDAMIAYLKSIR